MKKSIKILYILLLVCTIMLPFGVRAVVGSDSAIGSNNGTSCGNKCPTGDSTKVYIPIDSTTGKLPTKAIRVTLMDGNGNRINSVSSKNFAADTLWNDSNIKSYGAYISNGNSRVQIVNGATPSWKQVDVNKLDNYFTKDTNISNALKNDGGLSYASIADYFDTMANSADSVSSFLSTYFGVGDFKTNTSASNWFLLIEPLVPVRKDYKALVFGTPSEFSKHGDPAPILTNYNLDHFSRYNYLYITKTNFSDNGLSASFNALSAGNGSTTMVGTEKNGNGAGLVWIGKSANPKKACPSGTEKSGQQLLPSTCNTACSTSGYDSNNCCDKACKLSEVSCSSFQNRSNTWTEGWVYSTSKANKKLSANASTAIIRETCGVQYTCDTPEIYNSKTNFKDVQLTPNTSRDCCSAFENKYADDKNKLNELYRDHPECYKCDYNEAQAQAVCSTNKNKTTAGYTFTRNIGNATVTADTYTCVSKSASGESKNTSTNLFAKKIVNDVCKVICSETVDLEFPFLNNGVSAKYVAKNSIFSWPKKNATSDDSLKLKVKGNLTCWYHVDLVKLYNLFSTNKTLADQKFNACVNDMNKSLDNPSNILFQKYNLSGNYEVRYSDNGDNNGVALTKEVNTNSVSYIKNTNASKTTLAANQKNVKALVRYAESLKFTVSESANYVISDTGSNSGYIYSYGGKYYKNKIGISSVSENNILKIEPSLALNDKSGKGRVSIYYSNIGGTGTKFINNQKEYANRGLSDSYNNNRCTYIKTSDKTVECPSGTKNEGMNLSIIMENESLSYEEAVNKYCNNGSDSGMTVCPSNSYYSGKPISKSCYNKESCRELTCNIHECTDSGGTCHILNSCMTRQIENYGKTFEDAKKICTNKYCDGKPGNIEYRVIDLKDPFPGYEAKSGSSLFNSNIKGRKPGSNWNSTTIVQKEILNNRGVKGDEVYNLTPLYEFNLTPSVIKKIREYNDNHSYDDFTLSCKGNNKQACVASGFDFKTKFGIVKVIEQCKGISNLDKFNSCYNNDSLR
mgnify:CR=1 FL=1